MLVDLYKARFESTLSSIKMKDPIFADIPDDVADLTLEEYLKRECEKKIAELMRHADQGISQFKADAAKVRRELEVIVATQALEK